MHHHTITSSFRSLPVDIYWYPAREASSRVVLLLKGLFGLHVPGAEASWETELIPLLTADANVLCVNSARTGETLEVRSSKEAFVGKTFAQECGDIEHAYRFLCDEKILPSQHVLSIVGNSFGGTTLLGVPHLLHEASAVLMIGSGCGKSATTTKPLLMTLPDEEALLAPLHTYTGVFAFVRGAHDTVVPRASQEKIMSSAENARVNIHYEIAHAEHDLTSLTHSIPRAALIASILEHLHAIS